MERIWDHERGLYIDFYSFSIEMELTPNLQTVSPFGSVIKLELIKHPLSLLKLYPIDLNEKD